MPDIPRGTSGFFYTTEKPKISDLQKFSALFYVLK